MKLPKFKKWIEGWRLDLFFDKMFNSMNKMWEKLEPTIQDAILTGSGIVATLNEYRGKVPSELFDAIKQKYPNLDIQKFDAIALKVANTLGAVDAIEQPNLGETLKALSDYLARYEGKDWASGSRRVADLLATLLAPEGTKSGIIGYLLQWVYDKFIKK